MLDQRTLLRPRRVVMPLGGGRCQFGEEQLWNFTGNDYLGLADEPSVVSAAEAVLTHGVGARASALVTGRTPWHDKLERALANFKRTESAMLFPTGYAANSGTITALVGANDVVYCDRLNHASLIDGARNSKARFRVYPHLDTLALRKELESSQSYRRRLILTDSLFSMDGDIAPLQELSTLAEEFNAMLLVDEAHATGLFGDHGSGLLEAARVRSKNVIAVGTLSKALGSQGGFVAASQQVCDWLWNTARTSMFSTALAPAMCAAAMQGLKLIESEPQRRDWLQQSSQHVQRVLKSNGWDIPQHVRGPILPILIGDPQQTLRLADELRHQGILVAAIRPPTVPPGTSRIRISLSYAHGNDGIKALLTACARLEV